MRRNTENGPSLLLCAKASCFSDCMQRHRKTAQTWCLMHVAWGSEAFRRLQTHAENETVVYRTTASFHSPVIFGTALKMANSRFEYTRQFEQSDELLPQCWIVIRIDGKGFTKFCNAHAFAKPNDARALQLMDACAEAVMKEFGDIRIAFGQSDEFSFVFHKHTTLYKRRAFKLVSVVVSLFSATFVQQWPIFFPETQLQYLPMFDGRSVCYPNEKVLRDYLSWRQVWQPNCELKWHTCVTWIRTGMRRWTPI